MGAEGALAMQGFGVGTSTMGAFFNAQGQRSSLKSEAAIAELNAKMADMSSQTALLSGQRQEQAVKLNAAQIKSAQRTSMAANGVDLGSTTAVNILTSTDVLSEVDAATVSANAARSAFGYQTQALNFRNKARSATATAKGINPLLAAGGTLLAGAGTVAQSWYKLDQQGAFDKPSSTGSSNIGPQNDLFARMFGQHNLVSDALY